MKILILGGTHFLGRHLAEAVLTRGHELTLFNRGKTNPGLFPAAGELRGDRDGQLDALRGKSWDAVIDTCGYVPRLVRASAELLADSVHRYTFISSISVYADLSRPGVDESGSLHSLADETTEQVTGETYGGLKALCEQAAEAAMPGRVLSVRAGLIVGPHDPTGRFTYWPRRVARGGEVLAPGRPDRRVQFVDVRDLAVWIITMIERGESGTYNATGPREPLAIGELLDVCRTVTGGDATFVWVSEAFLKEKGVVPYAELPLWIPEELAGFGEVDCRRAFALGLTTRPLADTVRDTFDWDATHPSSSPSSSGLRGKSGSMPADREQDLLRDWRAKNMSGEIAP